MANVFTKKSRYPRSTTLSDYKAHFSENIPLPPICRPQARLLSPTRIQNPHPQGMLYQYPDGKASFSIWNKNFNETITRLPKMLNHQKWTNFTGAPPTDNELPAIHMNRKREVPVIRHTINTTSRCSYLDQIKKLPHLNDHHKTTRFGYTPTTEASRGIVPEATPPKYGPLSVLD